MKNTIQLLCITLLGAAALVACGDDTSATGGKGEGGSGGNPTTGGSPMGGDAPGGMGGTGGAPNNFPPAPELGAQIDRMGRPAINTALTGAFVQFDGANKVAPDPDERAALEDAYNAENQTSKWADYSELFAANLAVLDALDTGLDLDGPGGNPPTTNAQACTNQFGVAPDINNANGYATLAGALADDRLWLNVAGAGCSAAVTAMPQEGYLAVELNALGVTNTGCGGRRPIDDTIMTTYSALALGTLAGFDDGIVARAGQHPAAFPYLAAPQ